MSKRALITGVTGQDGSYLAEILLDKGYEVHGTIRRGSTFNTQRIDHIFQDPHDDQIPFHTHYGEMTDASNISRLIEDIEPDEIYNLAAQSNVAVSFDQPQYTTDTNALGTLRVLDAIRESRIDTRFYHASTSELYGGQTSEPLNEQSPFRPRSPYACSKLYAHWITINYRQSYGLHASNGICFNHESPRRGKRFVTRKITRAVAKINAGYQDKLYLGNLDAKRDWGYAPEYVEGMWQIVNQDDPDDYVLATGETNTVREFATKAFEVIGIDITWEGDGVDERGIDSSTGEKLVEVDPRYFRPNEVDTLIGDPTRAETELGWKAETSLDGLVERMVQNDVDKVETEGEVGLDYL
ncbi:GDPmannose 4,6-dehydratase [Halomicrobium zhouii]|uniref:GDP-mannose 4,6-dehydratase n=1 Tax=Halomicrobium zhouii TaxID=767519 RepID=A0A1I6KGA6_9EURY|nr:GDP-mannose 4,6-dehydratase [Halomicrobium zhouii]SFR90184.1 GDPmannose 4,6-dehydratase [Halomicrobium zhouii]